MSTGFSGGGPEFFSTSSVTGRSMMTMNNPQGPYRSPLTGNIYDPYSQIVHGRSDLIRKRSLAELQQQQQYGLGLYLRNVKQRTYQNTSPISPLSPMDFSASISSEGSLVSTNGSTRYGMPIPQQICPQPINLGNRNLNSLVSSSNHNFCSVSIPKMVPKRTVQESETKMMNRLQELEKELFDDNDEREGDVVSAVSNSEWSETIQSLIGSCPKPISPSPSSSSSSCSSSPAITCPKQSLVEVASAISEGKTEVAVENLTRLINQVSNLRGTSEKRLTAYMAYALRSRVNPTEYPPPVAELHGKDHMVSTQMLYDVSPCFKLGFMAANLAILDVLSENQNLNKLHVIDFDIGQGGQYVHLLHSLAARKADKPTAVKITTFVELGNGSEERLNVVGDRLRALANRIGVSLCLKVMRLKISDLRVEALGVESDEVLAVNFAFRLYKLPDESVTTENFRDELLRRVKRLSPAVVTVVEQDMNANTAPLVARVTEAFGYYEALLDSLDATVPRDNSERVKIEEGLGRKMANSIACEGRDRIERCEVFGKWRARMGMAGFDPNPLSQFVFDSVRNKLKSATSDNSGFTFKVENGGICFGWMGRTLTVASAWR